MSEVTKEQITINEFVKARPFIQFPGVLVKAPKTKVKIFHLKKWITEGDEIIKDLVETLDEEFPQPESFTISKETGEFLDGSLEDYSKWIESRKPREQEIKEVDLENFPQVFTLKELSDIEGSSLESMEYLDQLGLLEVPEIKKPKKEVRDVEPSAE